MMNRRELVRYAALLCGALSGAVLRPAAARETPAAAPPLMLAEVYRPGMSLTGWWVSEKYDGVRGWWDGQQLWTRGGERVVAPAWFAAAMPPVPLDGELWAGRGRFAQAVSTVRSQTPAEAAWRAMRFMVFDLPAQAGDFDARLAALHHLLPRADAPWLVPVAQQPATHHAELQALLDKTVQAGGEGLMLHRGASPYRGERSADLLKFKPYDDGEARVVAHVGGRGKHEGRLGALLVQTAEGLQFKLGTGFTDAQRRDPPPIGSWVSYRHNGANPGGVPRFARFVRVSDRV